MRSITELNAAVRECSSWDDIQGKLRDLSNKQKGDAFEELVKAYLFLEPEYSSKLKHVWLHREVPRSVAENLKLSRRFGARPTSDVRRKPNRS